MNHSTNEIHALAMSALPHSEMIRMLPPHFPMMTCITWMGDEYHIDSTLNVEQRMAHKYQVTNKALLMQTVLRLQSKAKALAHVSSELASIAQAG